MAKFLKAFDLHTNYTNYINSASKILPNVSLCRDENEVHFNPFIETRLVAKFNVTSTSSPTYIMDTDEISIDGDYYTEIEIDGVVQSTVVDKYTFSTTGEHIVKYTLTNPTTIGDTAFNHCNALTSIIIPNTVTRIMYDSFQDCTNLASVTIGSGVTIIEENAFDGCSSLTSITIPNSVTSIEDGVFRGCSGLTSITIPDSVTSIGIGVFNGCTGLTSITISNSVTRIEDWAFRDCSVLTSITIPNSVTSIGSSVFNGCTGLTSMTFLPMTAPSIEDDTFQNIKTNGTLYVPTGSTGYNAWLADDDYYPGSYGWTIVQQ